MPSPPTNRHGIRVIAIVREPAAAPGGVLARRATAAAASPAGRAAAGGIVMPRGPRVPWGGIAAVVAGLSMSWPEY